MPSEEDRAIATCNMHKKFGHTVFELCEWTDRVHKQTYLSQYFATLPEQSNKMNGYLDSDCGSDLTATHGHRRVMNVVKVWLTCLIYTDNPVLHLYTVTTPIQSLNVQRNLHQQHLCRNILNHLSTYYIWLTAFFQKDRLSIGLSRV